ncbi:hypothetical protein [Streptomyces humicola]|nr:hypothetical protein [Streptomyces humicola]
MDWLPLLSTLAGAAIGIVATLIADWNRWKREDHARWEGRGNAAAKMRKLMREDLGVGPLTEHHST